MSAYVLIDDKEANLKSVNSKPVQVKTKMTRWRKVAYFTVVSASLFALGFALAPQTLVSTVATGSGLKVLFDQSKLAVSTNGMCGNGLACPSSMCCSQYNYCGTSTDYCDAGCQATFGTCTTSQPLMTSNPVVGSTVPAWNNCGAGDTCVSGYVVPS